jgi:hypothetical protein
MHLETTETHASLALAIVPPGNVLRDLATIRGKLFTLNSLQGSRAWFDFPVLAWLGHSPDGGLLATIASSLRLPLEFGPLHWEDNFLALPLTTEFDPLVLPGLSRYLLRQQASIRGAGNSPGPAPGTEKWCPGPFPAGKGLICAILDPEHPGSTSAGKGEAGRSAILTEAARLVGQTPRATVYSLALIELHWYPGPDYGSSWAILSSAVAGNARSTGRPALANGDTA